MAVLWANLPTSGAERAAWWGACEEAAARSPGRIPVLLWREEPLPTRRCTAAAAAGEEGLPRS